MSRLYNILDKLIQRGEYFFGAWTVSSVASFNYPVTAGITLPAGVYVIALKAPLYINTSASYWFGVGTQSGIIGGMASSFTSQFACSWIVELTEETTVYGITQQSSQISMDPNQLERGYIKAVRIK